MTLDNLRADLSEEYEDIGDAIEVSLDGETRNELSMLSTAMDPEDRDELLRRAVHLLFQTAVETGKLDFNLRSKYDVTYDEYLSGMTYDEMTGADQYPQRDDERRYQM
jgi:hypothetical protein